MSETNGNAESCEKEELSANSSTTQVVASTESATSEKAAGSGTSEKKESLEKATDAAVQGVEDEELTAEEVVDWMEQDEFMQEQARAVLGGQDGKVCTFPEGYKPRQALYSCLTCMPSGTAGVCFGCSNHCHDGHDLVEMYTKRRFKCDCGNVAFAKKCTLYEDKPASNPRNIYNDNFKNLYCACKRPYPDPENPGVTMTQCAVCEDWYHLTHLDLPEESTEEEMVCKECASGRAAFLRCVSVSAEQPLTPGQCVPREEKKKEEETESAAHNQPKAFLLVEGWREKLCKCSKCQDFYDDMGCDWIHDPDDSQDVYAKEAEEKLAAERVAPVTDEEVAQELANDLGRDAAVFVLREFNHMKRKFSEFMQSSTGVIKAEDIKTFFDGIKKSRQEALRDAMDAPETDDNEPPAV